MLDSKQEIPEPTNRKSRIIVPHASMHNTNLEQLKELDSKLVLEQSDELRDRVNFTPLSDRPIHRWFKYREGYSVELVKKFIEKLPKGSLIVDPFCGAGTTLIAARELGYKSVGMDINPMSTLVSEVKTRNYKNTDVSEIRVFLARLETLTRNDAAYKKPDLKIIDKIFNKEILEALLITKYSILEIQSNYARDFCKVAWLAILEKVSNVFKEGNGIKYRNKKRTSSGSYTIPLTEWEESFFPKDKFQFVIDKLAVHLEMMITDLEGYQYHSDCKVYTIPADEVESVLDSNSAELVIFSPPYCNCFNYFKIFKVELWMGGFVNSYSEMKQLNRKSLRSHVETILKRSDDIVNPSVNNIINLIEPDNLWDKRIPDAVRGYFSDMTKVIKNIGKITKPSGKCIIVVGNSSYAGTVVPTDSLLANIALDNGFEVEKMLIARYLTTSSQQVAKLQERKNYLRESVLKLNKLDVLENEPKLVVVDEIPEIANIGPDSVFAIKNSGLTRLTHKFHRYPGKFIPHIPRWAINKYLKNQGGNVFDPFCGSGTTLVEARLLGHNAFGFDIDPIARLITKVKTTPIDEQRLNDAIFTLVQNISTMGEGKFRPKIETLEHWFNLTNTNQLSIIRTCIERFKDDLDIYEFMLVCFIAIIRRVSNADNQTQKTYVSHTKIKTPEIAIPLFLKTVEDYKKRIIEFSEHVILSESSVVFGHGDAREPQVWVDSNFKGKFDLAITSPPYVNSVDYVYNQMAEHFWIGDLFDMENQKKQNEHKKGYIGTDKVLASHYRDKQSSKFPTIDRVIDKVFLKNKKNSYVIAKYFSDMEKHLREVKPLIKNNGHYVIVVGDSVVSNEVIATHKYLQEIAISLGYEITDFFGYEIRNRHMRFPRNGRGGIIKYDWIIDLKV
jgi:DNA modification methylase